MLRRENITGTPRTTYKGLIVKHCYFLPWRHDDHNGFEVMLGVKNLEQATVAGRPVTVTERNRSQGKAIGSKMIPNYAGQWVIIGGGADAGESEEAAAEREFHEETGFKFDTPGQFSAKSYLIGTAQWACVVRETLRPDKLRAEIQSSIKAKRVPDDELNGVQWFDLATAVTLMNHIQPVPVTHERRSHQDRTWFVDILTRVREDYIGLTEDN